MSGLSSKARERLLYLISPIGLLLLWQVLLMVGIGDRRFIPAPSDIAVRFVALVASGELALHVGVTLYRVSLGFVIGVVPAVAMGLLMAMFKPVRIFFDPLIASLFPIPKIALMPLLLLAFGFGDASKIALVAIAVFFPVIVNTYVGAANIEKIYWDVAKNYGASQMVMFTRIVFFGALPTIFAGLAHRARGLVHRAGGVGVRRHQERHRLPDLELVGAPAGRHHVRRHRDHRHPRPDHLGGVPGDRAQGDSLEGRIGRHEAYRGVSGLAGGIAACGCRFTFGAGAPGRWATCGELRDRCDAQKPSTASVAAALMSDRRSGVPIANSSSRLMIEPASSRTAGMRVDLSTINWS